MNYDSVIVLTEKSLFNTYAGSLINKFCQHLPMTIIYTENMKDDSEQVLPSSLLLINAKDDYLSILEAKNYHYEHQGSRAILFILSAKLIKYKTIINPLLSILYLDVPKIFFEYNRDYVQINHVQSNINLIDIWFVNNNVEKELVESYIVGDIDFFVLLSSPPLVPIPIIYQGVISYNHIDLLDLIAFMKSAVGYKFYLSGKIILEEGGFLEKYIEELENVNICNFKNFKDYEEFFEVTEPQIPLEIKPLIETNYFYYPTYKIKNILTLSMNEIIKNYTDFIVKKLEYKKLIEYLKKYYTRSQKKEAFSQANIVIFYDPNACNTSTVTEHLESFKNFSKHNIFYAQGTQDAFCDFNLDLMDIVVVHYSVRISLKNYISPEVAKHIALFKGLKILFIQDEYENTNQAHEWIQKLGINIIFTCVSDQHIHAVYPFEKFSNIKFINNLTGYVPENLLNFPIKPLSVRKNHIVYRGRILPYWYGELGREKYEIGERMKAICQAKGLPEDIECDDEKRIYGDKWYEFLGSSRATLGTESGANIFDFDLSLRSSIEKAIRENPNYSYEEAKKDFLKNDGQIIMNQISPKIFQAIACRTALILYEGEYSKVLIPNKHYIPLKKDWSNIEDVLKKLEDLNYLEKLTEVAYKDIVKSGKYSYESFIKLFDDVVDQNSKNVKNYNFILTPTAITYHKNTKLFKIKDTFYLKKIIFPKKLEKGLFIKKIRAAWIQEFFIKRLVLILNSILLKLNIKTQLKNFLKSYPLIDAKIRNVYIHFLSSKNKFKDDT